MTFEDLLRYYKTKVPQGAEADGTPEYSARFNNWTSQLEKELGIPGGDFNDPASGWGGVNPAALNAFETQGGGGPTTTRSFDEDMLGRVIDDYVYPNLERDRTNRAEADRILAETNRSLDNAVRLNAENANSGFSAEGYIRGNYPNPSDWPAARAGLQTIVAAGMAGSLDEAAQYHFNNYGKAEGKQPSYVGTLGAERANAAEVEAGLAATARTQGTANQAGIDADQRNLSAAIAAARGQRLGAVDQSTAALRAGQGAQERDVIAATNARTTAIDGAITADDATRQAAIARMTATLRDASTQLDASRREALAMEIEKLKAGSSELTSTQLSALADETTSLGAALDLSAAARDRNLSVLEGTRLAAAEGQVAGVNLGLERTRDELSARQAERGFIGGSSMDDANLARAVVGARQQAAGVVGDTRVTNATDRRQLGDAVAGERLDLAARDATGRRTIVSDGAGRTFDIVGRDAGGGRTIADEGAARSFDITGQGAGLTREATFETSGNRFKNTAAGATDIFGAGKTGADTRFAITGADAGQRLGITAEAAGRGFDLAGQTGERTLGNVFAVNAGVKDAADKGTQMRSDYFDANNTRRLASALVPATIGTNRLSLLGAADEIGNANLKRSLDHLNFFTSNATPGPAGAFTTNPSQVGNDIAGLGAGIAGTAINIGNANKWWQTPKTATPKSTLPPAESLRFGNTKSTLPPAESLRFGK